MKIFAGGPVRNRGWILQKHIDALKKQKDVNLDLFYLLNNSTDNTEDILKENNIRYINYDIENATSREDRLMYSMDHLAQLRNSFLEEFLRSDCEYLFSIDSDILMIGDTDLSKLLSNNLHIVSILISNSPTIYAHNILNGNIRPKIIDGTIMEVDLTGAIYLIHREVIEAGVRYGYHKNGEDVVFCEKARSLGYKLYCDTRIHAIHAYGKNNFILPWTVPTRSTI